MNIKSKCEELKFNISRYDHYYDSINNKGNVYLTINIFILGGVISSCYILLPSQEFNICTYLFLVLTIFFNICSSIFTLKAIKPHLSESNPNPTSLIFFNDVAEYSTKNHQKLWNDLSAFNWYKDLTNQNQLLAKGLKLKFNNLAIATNFIIVQISSAIFLYSLIFLNK